MAIIHILHIITIMSFISIISIISTYYLNISAAPYCLSKKTLDTILGADRDEKNAYLIALAKNAQQVIRYVIYGLSGNYMNERVFTPRDVFPADDVKLHLGLTGDNARKCFMEL